MHCPPATTPGLDARPPAPSHRRPAPNPCHHARRPPPVMAPGGPCRPGRRPPVATPLSVISGKCERPGCKFVHEDPNASKAAASETGLIPPGVCRDFVRGKCTRTDCKFSHTEEEGKDAANRNGQMQRYTPY